MVLCPDRQIAADDRESVNPEKMKFNAQFIIKFFHPSRQKPDICVRI